MADAEMFSLAQQNLHLQAELQHELQRRCAAAPALPPCAACAACGACAACAARRARRRSPRRRKLEHKCDGLQNKLADLLRNSRVEQYIALQLEHEDAVRRMSALKVGGGGAGGCQGGAAGAACGGPGCQARSRAGWSRRAIVAGSWR
jgi:hypothetical protein